MTTRIASGNSQNYSNVTQTVFSVSLSQAPSSVYGNSTAHGAKVDTMPVSGHQFVTLSDHFAVIRKIFLFMWKVSMCCLM